MNTVDYLLLALLIISSLVGLLRGFLREAIALLAWVLAVIIAWRAAGLLEPHLGGLLALPQVRPWAARLIILIGVLLVGAAVGALVSHFVRLSIFSGTDRFLGFVFGLLRGVVILGVLVLFSQTLRLDAERWWHRSLLLPYGESVASGLRTLLGEELKGHRDLRVFNSR
jgi:membrane protein required for colicin V production